MFGGMATSGTASSKKMLGIFAVFTLAASANAHLFLQYPAPIEGSAPKDPLEADGSNFPFHGVPLPTSGGEKFAAGSSHLLQFDAGGGANTAVHGGGSCQISVNYGDDPKDPKNWFVIHSMEGGCPTLSAGNLDGQYTGPKGAYSGAIQCTDPRANGVDCINSYNFSIPQGMKSGHATISWTWFNTIGNREIYQNCVSAEIQGGDGSEISELPTMFVANLAKSSLPQCSTTEGEFYKFPFPGKYVTSDTKGSQYKLATLNSGACAKDGAPVGGAAAAGSSSGAAPSSGGSSPPASSSGGQVTVTTMQTLTSGSTAPTSAPAPPASSAAPSAAAPAPSSAAASAPYPSSPSSSSVGSGSCPAGAKPCSSDGEVVCMGNQWGLCSNGCAVPQSLAAGTTCTNGKIAKRDHIRRHIGRNSGRGLA